MLGGGLVPGTLVLIGGDPGIGKSTLMLQVFKPCRLLLPRLLATGNAFHNIASVKDLFAHGR